MTYGNETQTQSESTNLCAALGKTQGLRESDHTRDDRAREGLRSPGVGEAIQGQSEDDWLRSSVELVAGALIGHAENQRRVRYFGFETAHD